MKRHGLTRPESLACPIGDRSEESAAIDRGPSVLSVEAIAQQPQVDVIECERQRLSYPVNAGRDLAFLAGVRQRVAEGIVELGFLWVHEESPCEPIDSM